MKLDISDHNLQVFLAPFGVEVTLPMKDNFISFVWYCWPKYSAVEVIIYVD